MRSVKYATSLSKGDRNQKRDEPGATEGEGGLVECTLRRLYVSKNNTHRDGSISPNPTFYLFL